MNVLGDCRKCGNKQVQFNDYFSKKYQKRLKQSSCNKCRSLASAERARRYRLTERGRAITNKNNRASRDRQREKVDESYAKGLLVAKGKFTLQDIKENPELIAFKQAQVLLAREIKRHG